jgi:hypothetical protein
LSNYRLVEGQVLYVLSDGNIFTSGVWAKKYTIGGVDGCYITGGAQSQPQNPATLPANPTSPGISAIQGGGITIHERVKYFRITNNLISGNSGSYGGAIRVGTPFLNQITGGGNSYNTFLTISRNSILYNGGINLGGAIALFGGSDQYVVQKNYICGNNAQEYGGGISHFGASKNGLISDNWILWNRAFDQGGGICIASEILSSGLQIRMLLMQEM